MIHCDTAVSISIIRKSDIQSVIDYIFLQNLDMGGTAVCVNIGSVRLVVDHIGLRLKCIEYTLGNR